MRKYTFIDQMQLICLFSIVMPIDLHIIATTFFSIESLEVSSKQFFYVYTYVHSLEFFMGTIVQLADLMEAATWMTTSCTAALPSFSCAALMPCHSAAACVKRRAYAVPCCDCLCRAYAAPGGAGCTYYAWTSGAMYSLAEAGRLAQARSWSFSLVCKNVIEVISDLKHRKRQYLIFTQIKLKKIFSRHKQ